MWDLEWERVMKVRLTLGLGVGAGGTEPWTFGDGSEDGAEAVEVVALIAFVAEKQLGGGVTGATFLAENVVV